MGMRKAIDEKCRDCIYDKTGMGTWRAQVAACQITACPLWEYRPVPIGQGRELRSREEQDRVGGIPF